MNESLTLAEIAALLPDVEEVRPAVDHLLARSEPDPSRRWAGSGILGAAGDRVVPIAGIRRDLEAVREAEEDRRRRIFEHVGTALEARAAGDPERCADELLAAAAIEESVRRFVAASSYADAAFRVLETMPDSPLRRRALRRRARALRSIGQLRQAIDDYRRAFELAVAAGDVPGGAEAAIGAGNCLEDRARWDEALQWYRLAVEVAGDDDDAATERWQALLNEHIVLRSQGRLDEAAEALERAGIAAEGADGAELFLENARGQWALARGDTDEAMQCLRSALSRAPMGRARVTVRLNLAEALLAAGRDLEAAEEVRGAEYDAIVGRAGSRLPEVYRLLGRIGAERGEAGAFVLFEKALGLIDDHGLPPVERARTLQAYAEAERRTGDDERAKAMLTEATRIYADLGVGLRTPWGDRHEAMPESEFDRNDS